jgi:uncharacterized membrane protein YkvA (DUF1232 family)
MALTLASAAHWALQFPKTAMLAARLFLDARVPAMLKWGALAGALLIISPIDLLGDIPVLGPVDDIGLLMLLVTMFVRLCPPNIVREHETIVGAGATAGMKPQTSPSGGSDLKNVTPQ